MVVREGQNPISQEFGTFIHQTRVGMRMDEALESMRERVGSDDLTLMVGAIEVARQTGGNLTEVFEKIAHTVRERMRIEQRIRTLTAQGRLQGIVVGCMPLLLGVAMFMLDPAMMAAFLKSGAGMAVLVLVGILEILGALVIRKIIAIDV
jgi:tight adherence protein B